MSLPSSSMRAHLPGYPQRLAKMWGHILASSYCSRKVSTSRRQSVYVTSTPGSVDLKISITNLAGASHFLSLLPLWPLHLCQQPTVSLTVEYPSESGAPLSGEEGETPSTDCNALGLWWPSTWLHGPCTGVWPCLSHLNPPYGSSSLLRCTSHQLARGVRLPCCSNWHIMGRVTTATPPLGGGG